MTGLRSLAVWVAIMLVMAVPLIAASFSPLLAWRQPVYIGAGFAGIIALVLLLVQPLLAHDALPGLVARQSRALHRITGFALLAAMTLHVAGLWITSPPDVVDALLLRSPTWFSLWGVIAMWAVLATALLFAKRSSIGLRTWRRVHTALAVTIVTSTIAHAMLIDGTMEIISKTVLCVFVAGATLRLIIARRAWSKPR